MLKSFNVSLYASTLSSLVAAAGKLGEAATAHAPTVLVGMLEGAVTDETYLAALCTRAGVLSAKGKANANALETNGYGAAKRVYTEIKRIIKHIDVAGVRPLVEGFSCYLPDWAEAAPADDADAKVKAAYTRMVSQEIKARYPDRPTSFAALVKAVTTAINAKAKADAEAAGETVPEEIQPETTAETVTSADKLGELLELLRSIDTEQDAGLLVEIASEIDRIAALATPVEIANVG